MTQLIFTDAALDDILQISEWYGGSSGELSEEFSAQVDRTIALIKQYPLLYPVFYKKYHRAVLRQFPYLLVYRVTDQRSEIVAVGHAKRGPKFWKSRL